MHALLEKYQVSEELLAGRDIRTVSVIKGYQPGDVIGFTPRRRRPVRLAAGGSWTTGTQTEALSANNAVGTAFASFTSAQYIGPSASAAAYLPANFFLPSYGSSKSLLLKAFGVISTTGTPNFTMGVTANTTQGTYNSSGILATTAATAQGSGETNVPWELEVLITCSGTGSSGSFLSDGLWKVYPTGTSLIAARCSSSTANPNTALTLSTESAYYVELAGTFSASSASNTVQCYNVAVLGLN
jgi:hypothetical protein